jgi:hypothetical protein
MLYSPKLIIKHLLPDDGLLSGDAIFVLKKHNLFYPL